MISIHCLQEMEEDNSKNDPDYEMTDDMEDEEELGTYNWNVFRQTIETAMRHGISNRALASLINSLLVDLKIKDKSLYVSVHKIIEMKKRHGKLLEQAHLELNKALIALGWDGTRDEVKLERGQSEMIENLSFTNQVTKKYLDHESLKNSKAETIFPIVYKVIIKSI